MNKKIVKVKEYKVADGDTLDSIAKQAGMTWQELAKFNWGTNAPKEINNFMRNKVGCRKKANDGVNYIFTSKDTPGIVYIPEVKELEFASSAEHTIKVKVLESKLYPTSKCTIKFRPQDDWKGEFGFDWLRETDTAIIGDAKYENIVGKYGATYATEATAVFTKSLVKFTSLKNNNYDPFQVHWKKDGKEGAIENKVSWLTLFPEDQCKDNTKKCEAKLSLQIEIIDDASEVLRIDYNKDFFKLDKTEVTPKSVGKHKMDLTIKCIKEFSSDEEIKVVNETNSADGNFRETVAGRLMMVKNDKAHRYKANIVFVKVATKINTVANIATTANEQSFLEKYMYQSLATLNLKEEELDLKTNVKFNTDWTVQKTPTVKAVKNNISNVLSIHTFLENEFKKLQPTYNDWYKIFFFDEAGGNLNGTTYNGLNGAAKGIPSKSVVLYKTHNTATTTHELLHAMGLYHSFDNDSTYTFKIGETENIMDYSHQDAYGNKSRISTWKWHWDKLHQTLLKE